MPKDLPFGEYKIEYEIVTACYFCCIDGRVNECFGKSDSIVQIHYVVDGFQEIKLLLTNNSAIILGDECESRNRSVEDLVIKQKMGDFIVIFPGEIKNKRIGAVSEGGVKKVVISMPVQRVF